MTDPRGSLASLASLFSALLFHFALKSIVDSHKDLPTRVREGVWERGPTLILIGQYVMRTIAPDKICQAFRCSSVYLWLAADKFSAGKRERGEGGGQ
ncbi:hypothetical protein BO70DRAFT_357674 [Aspergillus heteromorphus CBS 117.55]|uniref:Uncharacterized protein n=1 Tax=Aspergillus heteromorphus CBS 117.55 TaxID=1448321 RepID=A0A317X4U9_9EURO|nr:uncharacterized protein BO70DRAFT_357674 [Aspergillus heteromorphus CBS 117.55]PWY92547.1 hypothetical protein BO70DRAFT_357674 [Aspergillus heteromorphus CBS 117.55]